MKKFINQVDQVENQMITGMVKAFPFLRKLDELPDRPIDNAGFMHVNDLEAIGDAELYDRLLNGFPRWLADARQRGILTA